MPASDRTQPTLILRARAGNRNVWERLQNTRFFRGSARGPRAIDLNVSSNYAEILRLHLDRQRVSSATAVMRTLAREDAQTFNYFSWSLREIIEQYELGAKGVPILRLLYSHNPSDAYMGLTFGRALYKAKRYEEAHRVLVALCKWVCMQCGYEWKERYAVETDEPKARD